MFFWIDCVDWFTVMFHFRLLKSCKNSIDMSCILFTRLPVRWLKLRNEHRHNSINQSTDFILILPIFPLIPFFCSRILAKGPTLHLVVISPQSPLVCNRVSVFSFMTLILLKSAGLLLFWRLSLNLVLSDVFPSRLSLCSIEENNTEWRALLSAG